MQLIMQQLLFPVCISSIRVHYHGYHMHIICHQLGYFRECSHKQPNLKYFLVCYIALGKIPPSFLFTPPLPLDWSLINVTFISDDSYNSFVMVILMYVMIITTVISKIEMYFSWQWYETEMSLS